MLLDKQYTTVSTLYLVINVNSVEYAVFDRGEWIKSSISKLDVDIYQNTAEAMPKLTTIITSVCAEIEEKAKNGTLPTIKHLSVMISDHWLPSVLTPWVDSAAANKSNAKLITLSQFNYLGFNVQENDTVKFLEFGYKKPSLAIGYPQDLMASLFYLRDKLNLRLTSVLPTSLASFNVVKPEMPKMNILGVYTPNLLTVIDAHNGLVEIKPKWLDDESDLGSELDAEWKRIKFRFSHLANVKRLPLLNLTSADIKGEQAAKHFKPLGESLKSKQKEVPKSLAVALQASKLRLPIDADPQGYLLTKLHWVALAFLLVVIGLLSTQIFKANQQIGLLVSDINSKRASYIVEPVAEVWTKQEIKQVRVINATIRQLNLPFSTFMEALQPPSDIRVSILSLDLDAAVTSSASHIKILAEAKSSGEMAQYISFLSGRKIFSGVFLTSHERIETLPQLPYRFNVELTWEDAS